MDEKPMQRSRCEVYSRVVGYLRPVDQWNEGKQAEYVARTEYVIENNTPVGNRTG